jgi:glutathione S-transferase
MGMWPWVRSWKSAQFSSLEMERFPFLLAWIERVAARPAVQRAISDKYDSEANTGLRVSSR